MLLATLLWVAGCGSPAASGPPTVNTDSSKFATHAEKVALVEKYVSFRRSYESLDFTINFLNGGGTSPSEWDIRLIAVVPEAEISQWTAGFTAGGSGGEWIKTVPTSLDLTGVTEWHTAASRTVGIDRGKRIVVYRNVAN
jgi:hypothetical protein